MSEANAPKTMIAHIVAASENNVIGKDGELPWSIPEDMKWFRERTKKRVLIMGRKTFESVGHPLPQRLNIVVTRQKDYGAKLANIPEHSPVKVVSDLSSALQVAKDMAPQYHDEIFIIGGGEIYKQSMDVVDTVFLTRVHKKIEGDAYYPEVPKDQFTEADSRHFDGDPNFSILTYKRR